MLNGDSTLSSVAAASVMAGSVVKTGIELFGGVGQALELKRGEEHHEADMLFNRLNYHQDKQNLRLDALDHAKEEVRSHYDTYVGRIDTLLLVLALIWPFALNTIQFSDPFLPQDEEKCPDCIEVQHELLVHAWVLMNAIILILPFWGILCLIRVKLKLDGWLEYSLAGLKKERRQIVVAMTRGVREENKGSVMSYAQEEDKADKHVRNLVLKVSEYQDYLAKIWTNECSFLVHSARNLLWMSAYAALALTALSVWMFLWNKGNASRTASYYFALIIAGGFFAPLIFWLVQWYSGETESPEDGSSDGSKRDAGAHKFHLASPSAAQTTQALNKGFTRGLPRKLYRQKSPLSTKEYNQLDDDDSDRFGYRRGSLRSVDEEQVCLSPTDATPASPLLRRPRSRVHEDDDISPEAPARLDSWRQRKRSEWALGGWGRAPWRFCGRRRPQLRIELPGQDDD